MRFFFIQCDFETCVLSICLRHCVVSHFYYFLYFQIPVVKDLPVGENLHDHAMFGPISVGINKAIHVNEFSLLSPKQLWNYYKYGTGKLIHRVDRSTFI